MHNGGTTEQDELSRLVREAVCHLESRQRRISQLVRDHDQLSVDRTRGTLTLRARSLPLLSTRVALVGHHHCASSLFRWAWADPDSPPALTALLEDVRAVGESRGFAQLVRPEWKASKADAWHMASITALVLDGRGIHRVKDGSREALYVLLDPLTFESLPPPAAGGEW